MILKNHVKKEHYLTNTMNNYKYHE